MTAYAFMYAMYVVFSYDPALVLVNGPGTCIPIALAAFVCRLVGWNDVAIVFVESAARVKDLSFSGKILYHFVADRVFVQWKSLKARYKTAEMCGLVL